MGNGQDKHEPASLQELIQTFSYADFTTHEGYVYYRGWSLLAYSLESQAFLLYRYRNLWAQEEQNVHDTGKNR